VQQQLLYTKQQKILKKFAGFPAWRGIADTIIRRRNEASPRNKKEK